MAPTATTADSAMVEAIRDAFQRRIRAVSIATTRAGSSIARPIIRVKW
jgi:hypothetical protein